jgi:DNA primase
MYSREVVAEVLAANDIVQIIGAFVELKGAGGGRKKGLCPFHREKTPSFVVSQDKQIYNCFGCGKHGDAISFVMEHEGLAFVEALQKLADRGNVRLPAPTGGQVLPKAVVG